MKRENEEFNWEEKFNERFSHDWWCGFVQEQKEGRGWNLVPIIDFIHNLLLSRREEIIKKLEGMKETPSIFNGSDVFLTKEQENFNQALSEAINTIRELK